MGTLPPSQVLQLDLVLPLSDEAGLDAFLSELYNPSSASYRHFLSVQEFTARFGPSQAQYDAVVNYATRSNLTIVGGTRDGMDVQVTGTVAAVEAAFHVTLRTYLDPKDNRTYYSPDAEPTTGLPFNLWHIAGLDDLAKPHPLYESKESYAKAHGIPLASVVAQATTASGPSASFLGSDMRVAYYNGPLTGAGQNLGLFEFGGTDLADLNTYYENVTQTYPGSTSSTCTSGTTCTSGIITLLSTDGTSTYCVDSQAGGFCDDTEATLDMTQALGMAPGLASLTMYIGNTDTKIISAMVSHNPLPTTIGCSWYWSPTDSSTLDPYFKRMAAQGQTFFAASGDRSTWSTTNNPWPADDPYVVSVGGTDLVTASAAGPWKSETAWV